MKSRRQSRCVTIKLSHDTFRVDRRRVLDAMEHFDLHHRQTEPISGTKFALIHGTRIYPPKRVLGLAIGRPTTDFPGGKFTNSVLRELDFEIGPAPANPTQHKAFVNDPVPTVGEVLSRLFSQKWTKLNPGFLVSAFLDNGEFPGVYLIAYSREDLEGTRVDEHAVFYVGMSNHAGLRKRIGQFVQGIEDGGHHSAAKRFFKKLASGTPYSRLQPRQDFFFAWAPVPCVTTKRERTPRDLRKMGVVAAAELFALARIRQKTGREPQLNEQ